MIHLDNTSRFSTGQCESNLKRTSRRIGQALALSAVLLCPLPAIYAQTTSADILGTVTDVTGAVIPNATVTIVNLDTHDQRTATTNGSGDYQFTLLPVGRYQVTVKEAGFKTATTTNLAVEAGDRARSDVKLETGGESQTVTVEAQTPLLQADNATVSSTVTAKAVQDLPLNGRNFVQLVQLVPGANEGPGNGLTSGGRPDDRRSSASFSVNGQDDTLNNFVIDGTDDNERVIGTIGVRPNVEGIQEITVETNSYSAEAGRTAGGVVSIITKSGTNQFHGSAYEFFRNDIFDARNVLQTTGRKPELRQNQFGGSIGGPIFRDRTFFFGDYEGLRLVSGVTYTNSVPQIAQYNDINSLNGGSPQALVLEGHGTAPYAGKIDPIALAYLKLFPAPTNSSTTNNYIISPNKTQSSNTADARVDHKFNGNNILFGRFTYNKVDTFTPAGLGTVGGFDISGGRYNFSGPATDKAYQYGAGFTHIFNQNLLVDLRLAYTRINNLSLPLNNGKNPDIALAANAPGSTFGTNNNNGPLSSFLTPIQFGPFNDIGDGAYVPLQDIDNTFQYSGSVSYTRGNHNLKFGGGLIRRQARNVQSAFAAGQYTFGLSTDNDPNTTQSQINALASSLVGAFSADSRNVDLTPPDYRSWEPSFFGLDSWKVNSRLTVLYGARYDVFTPFTEAHNRISNFDFGQAASSTAASVAPALKVAGVNGVDGHAGVKVDYSNFAPRVGFSFSVMPKTVLRGGYGLSFFPGNYTSNADLKNAPFVSVFSPNCQSAIAAQIITSVGGTVGGNGVCGGPGAPGAPATFDEGLPLPTPQTINSPSLSFVAENPKFRSALIQQFNLQIEQQFGSNVFTIGYVGNTAQHLPETINDVNMPKPFSPSADPATLMAQEARPLATQLPNLSGVGYLSSEGISNYNALQTSLQRRFTKGLAMDLNYTWAKALSDNTGFSQEGKQGWSNTDPSRINTIEYGVAENDIQNRFAASINYELQYGKNFTGIKKFALHGWEANTILVWQSGKPFSILNGGQTDVSDSSSAAAGTAAGTNFGNRAVPYNNPGQDRPNQVSHAQGPKTLTEYFNTADYAPQPLGTIGTAQRNSEFGPHFRHVDLSIFKDFPVTERINLQFRAEAFDITNTPDYYIPNGGSNNAQLGNSTFGHVTDYDPNYNPRQLQFALKAQF